MKIIIPARGGSKRIPKKNLLDLNGKSLLYYSIKTSLNITDDVYVSTEDKEIKKFSESMNVNVIDRPEKLAADESKTEDVVKHFLEEVDMNGDDLFCVVQPTSPLLHFNSILDGMELMEEYDSVISVLKDVAYFWDSNGKPINFKLGERKRTQEHDCWFRENGAFYITTKDNFLKKNILQNGNVGFVVMDKISSLDIDDYEDFNLVKGVM